MSNPKRYYKAKKGETLEVLAKRHKYKSAKLIWQNVKENKALVKNRGKPPVIEAGDMVYMPVTPEERKSVEKELQRLNDMRNEEHMHRVFMADEIEHLKITSKILAQYVVVMNQYADHFVAEINSARKGIKNWATGVDVAATLINLSRSLAKLGQVAHKASLSSGAELAKINAELANDIKKQVFGKNMDGARKALVSLKGTRAEMVSILNDSFDKMTSPSFWAMTWVQYYKEGKTFSDSVTYDVDEDFDNKIAIIRRDYGKATKEIKAEIAKQAKIRAVLDASRKTSMKKMLAIEALSIKLMGRLD